ncbi:HET-domain-containing protein [Lepidopterella palustris CBS 459.81]|uniref:HET-domain-containing protein n=1 Tax=Lepidopterella palustris CBS 459.81 TaxID=1314670 RepID=A0A8E2DW56_9PEZI|nr:HET-domain-containing protein [Lepidopterella palustris CBS 459.81]
MSGDHLSSPPADPLGLQAHSCKHCSSLVIDIPKFGDVSRYNINDQKCRFTNITIDKATEAGRLGCKLLAWTASKTHSFAFPGRRADGPYLVVFLFIGKDSLYLRHVAFQWTWSGGPGPAYEEGDGATEKLTVYVPPGDPVSPYIRCRPAIVEAASTETFEMARRWLRECRSSPDHSNCGPQRPNLLPRRVLYVGTQDHPKLRLFEPPPQQHLPYAALSYCWGSVPMITTTKSTLQQFSMNIAMEALPCSIQDAVFVCRQLSLRYLWVDALCIVQDDSIDLKKSLDTMCDIYSRAEITIMAARARAADQGFLDNWTVTEAPELTFRLPAVLPNGVSGSVILYSAAVTSFRDEPVETRGWTMQEKVLSSRILYFGNNRLSWICASTAESPEHTDEPNRRIEKDIMHLRSFYDGDILRMVKVCDRFAGFNFPAFWDDIVEIYTLRKLSFPEDKLPAIAGLAEGYKRAGKFTSVYLAGLWEDTLTSDLLWKTDSPGTRPLRYKAPSWSWASIDSPVTFLRLQFWDGLQPKHTLEAIVLECSVIPALDGGHFGAVKAGQIRLQGRLRQFLWSTDFGTIRNPDIPGPEGLVEGQAWPDADEKINEEVLVQGQVFFSSVFYFELKFEDYVHGFQSLGLVLCEKGTSRYKRIGLMRFSVLGTKTESFRAWMRDNNCQSVTIE